MNVVEIRSDKKSIKVGEHLTLYIKAPSDGELVLPFKVGEIDKSGLAIISNPKYQGDEIVFDITSYKTGDVVLPSFQVKVKDEVILETVSLNIKVDGKTSEVQLVDIKPPKEISPSIFYYIGIIAVLLFIIIGLRYIYKRFFNKIHINKNNTVNCINENITAFDKAMRDLNNVQINHQNFANNKEFVFKITEILKKFLEEEYHIDVMDLTTTELISLLRSDNRFVTAIINDLAEYFRSSDFIKFANNSNNEHKIEHVEKAKNFVSLLRLQ